MRGSRGVTHIIASSGVPERLSDSQGRPLHLTSYFSILQILSRDTTDVSATGLRTEIRTLNVYNTTHVLTRSAWLLWLYPFVSVTD